MIVIDGENCILGRLCSYAAKELMKGEEIRIVNADKIVVIGDPKMIVEEYRQRINIRDPAKPEKSPNYPKRPDLFVKRAIRGMLPWQSSRGKEAYRRILAYIGVPKEFHEKGKRVAELNDRRKKNITVEEICRELGWRVKGD